MKREKPHILTEAQKAELQANAARADLRAVETHNTGYSLEHHDRATLAAAHRPLILTDLPIARPTVIDPNPK